MLINILIVAIIFGYATYTLWKFFKRTKQGKCIKCELKNTCESSASGCIPDNFKK